MRKERIELLESIVELTRIYLPMSEPHNTELGGPAMTKRDLEWLLESLNDLDNAKQLEDLAKAQAQSRGMITGDINQTDAWFKS